MSRGIVVHNTEGGSMCRLSNFSSITYSYPGIFRAQLYVETILFVDAIARRTVQDICLDECACTNVQGTPIYSFLQ